MEIERKFLLKRGLRESELIGKPHGVIYQSYLPNGIRVRHADYGTSIYTMTLKQTTPQQFARLEWEEQIPYWVYKEISSSQGAKHLMKHRYTWEEDGKKIRVRQILPSRGNYTSRDRIQICRGRTGIQARRV